MGNSEVLRKLAIDFFSGTDYLRDGFITVGGIQVQGGANWRERCGAAARALKQDANDMKEVLDLTQAISFVRGKLSEEALKDSDLVNQVYKIWAGRTLCSAAQMLADQIESDSEKVEVESCSCRKEDCELNGQTEIVRIWHRDWERLPHHLYGDILYLSGYMPRNMGTFRPLRRLVQSIANKFSRPNGQPTDDDFDKIPAHLRNWEWQDCRFDQGETTFTMANRDGNDQTFDFQSVTNTADKPLRSLWDAATRDLLSRGLISIDELTSLLDTLVTPSAGDSGTVKTSSKWGDVTTGFNLSLRPSSPEKK
jgi:hypothetical protein